MNLASGTGNARLNVALFVAAAAHCAVIFGVSFEASHRQKPDYQVEVTLVQTPAQRPDSANHIAQVNQRGSGEEALRDLTSGQPSAMPQPLPTSAQQRQINAEGRERLATSPVTSTEADDKVVDRRGEQSSKDDLPEAERELRRLNEELARLQSNLDTPYEQVSTQPRVRRLAAVAAMAAVDAAYLEDWRRRVEAVGNQFYPEASLRYGIFGSLKLLVTVRSDGSLDDIRILQSSGYAVLDESAVRIVRRAAPFAPFPQALRETTDKLEIVRTWQFEENPLSSR